MYSEWKNRELKLSDIGKSLDHLQEGFIVLDRDANILFYNSRSEELLNLDKNPPEQFHQTSIGKQLIPLISECISTGENQNLSHVEHTAQGLEAKRLRLFLEPVENHVYVFVRDMYYLGRTSDGVSENEAFSLAVMNSLIAVIAVIDVKGRILAVNDAWKKFAGDNGASLKTVRGAEVNYLEITHAAAQNDKYAEQAYEGIQDVLNGKLPVFRMEYSFDLPLGAAWFEMYVSRLQRVEGGAVISHYSIDNRKITELETQKHRTQLNAVFQSVNDGLLTFSSEYKLEMANDAARKILEMGDSNTDAHTLSDLADGELSYLEKSLEKTLLKGWSIRDYQIELTLPSGLHKVLMVSMIPMREGGSGVRKALLVFRDVTRLYTLQQEVDERRSLGKLIGASKPMQEIFKFIQQLAPTKSTVLVLGESGTGKGMIANLLHQLSDRREKPFVAVNCAALSDSVLQSELFGHVRGAYTGAVTDRVGRFEAASGGTIFLDEIGDISPIMQAALLRVLEEGKFERVGDSKTRTVDVRIVTATNQHLEEKVEDGTFRKDLYYRLNVMAINLPPLRERMDDLPLLLEEFRKHFNGEIGRQVKRFSPEAVNMLQRWQFPGNIRELRNIVERAFILCQDDVILPVHLQLPGTPGSESLPSDSSAKPQITKPEKTKTLTVDLLLETLELSNWNISETARRLGYTRQYVHQRIKKYRLRKE